jgi:hypothetical protein
MDVWGLYPIEGYYSLRYTLFLTDDATRWTWWETFTEKGSLMEVFFCLYKKIQRTMEIVIRRYWTGNESVRHKIKEFHS